MTTTSPSILSRYLDPEALGRMAGRTFDPRGLVIGSLAGHHRSPLSGFAVEFAGHREYVPGDDPKHIDWRVYYNRDKYFIKQYEMETNLVCHLLLDVSASMRYGEGETQKLLAAAQLAIMLAHCVVRQGDKVAVATFDEEIRGQLPAGGSPAQITRFIEHLESIEPVKKTRMADCLGAAQASMGRREIVVVFSDFFTDLEALEKCLQRFRYDRHEVVLFQVLHPDELEFRLDGLVKFRGLESDAELLAAPSDLRTRYLAALRSFNERLADVCSRNRVERVLVDTGRDRADVLIDHLNARGLVHRGRG